MYGQTRLYADVDLGMGGNLGHNPGTFILPARMASEFVAVNHPLYVYGTANSGTTPTLFSSVLSKNSSLPSSRDGDREVVLGSMEPSIARVALRS